jgi:hypothetical protein
VSPARELISSTTRGRFRDLTTGSTHGRITAAFQDEGFAPNPDSTWDDGSVRRTTAQHYLEAVNWADPGHITRALRAMARLGRGSRVRDRRLPRERPTLLLNSSAHPTTAPGPSPLAETPTPVSIASATAAIRR